MQKPEFKYANRFRERLHIIIFEADTRAGKAFDLALLLCIVASILVVTLESVPSLQQRYGHFFFYLEWAFTLLFTLEYLLRIFSTHTPKRYIFSFFGIIDLLAILPAYIGFFVAGTQALMLVRGLRILRIFRILKLGHFIKEGRQLTVALKASVTKISVFLLFVIILVIILGGIMYLVEGGVNERFASIPVAIYWAIVTLTTVGYGDITPITPLGQFLSALIMIFGYAIIAVPTGIVTGELLQQSKLATAVTTQVCQNCTKEGHDPDAGYCKYCGVKL